MHRMTELTKYEGWDWLNNSRNPGAKVDMDFIMGKGLDGDNCKSHETGGEAEEYHQRFYEVCKGRTFFVTENGMVAIGPSRTQAGDFLVVFRGARTPFVARRDQAVTTGPSRYRLVGEAFVHQYMDGEAFESEADTEVEEHYVELC